MKKIFAFSILLILLLSGCSSKATSQIVATTLPVYEFASALCEGTNLTVSRLVTENVSCLHDYSLQVAQMRALESAEVVVINGAGLEDFLADALTHRDHVIDASENLELSCGHYDDDGHHHENDPHIWLSPELAKEMCKKISNGLTAKYPRYGETFSMNLEQLVEKLNQLQVYGETELKDLKCRKLITFHDGFSYFAESFDLQILKTVEEDSGSEASAKELIGLIALINSNHLPAIFTETNGSTAAAQIISKETDVKIHVLDMGMSGSNYFEAMYRNIDTVKEALK